MAAILLGTAGVSFGLIAETGGFIQNVEIRLSREKADVKDPDGDITAVAYFNPTEEISFDHVPTGSTGIAAASPGVAVTLANYTPTAGSIITEEVTTTRPNTDYKRVSVRAMVHPLI